jgi:hypothetical protein
VSELPRSSPYRSTPDAPVEEGERGRLNERLNAAFEAGGLDAEDYRARLDRLYAARTLGELVPVVQGLPPMATHAEPAVVAGTGGRPGELTPARDARPLALLAVGGVALAVVLVVLLVALLL